MAPSHWLDTRKRLLYCAIWTICFLASCISSRREDSTTIRGIMRKEAPHSTEISGLVAYADGRPASEAVLVLTEIATGAQVAIVKANETGQFKAPVSPGDYAVAVTAERGAVWIESQKISKSAFTITVPNECAIVSGQVSPTAHNATQIHFSRRSFATGDTFVVEARSDGSFASCVPPGEYIAAVKGAVLSLGIDVTAPVEAPIRLHGYASDAVRSAPKLADQVAHDIEGLIDDIIRNAPKLIGLGEAAHGSAEFVAARARLTFALAQRAQVQLLLLENDAIAAFELERYVSGDEVDLYRAIGTLGFWMTDTYEFAHFLEEVRKYNLKSIAGNRIHVAGVDVQNTELPAGLLLANTAKLQLSEDEKDLLRVIAPARGKAVKQFSGERRHVLDSMLQRLSTPAGPSDLDTRLAVAARSLATQIGYLDGDTQALYAGRRDAGMAELAAFVVGRLGVARAVLWAHDDHISRVIEGSEAMGHRLSSAFAGKYYPIGFYMFEGSTRAWDAGAKIGVVSHPIPSPPPYAAERVLMTACQATDIAWLPLRRLPSALQIWLETPRFVREFGAVYYGEERSMLLVDLRAAFDALVVIRSVHDSSPTPTGIRRAH